MRIPGVRRLRRALHRRRGQDPSALLLMYHRVAEEEVDPWGLSVTPQHFEAHLDVLLARGPVLPLGGVVGRDALPDSAVVVTFDDGYEDTLAVAAPLLARYGIPATVFVTTAGFDGDLACWWDVLAELLLRPGRVPEMLRLCAGGVEGEWTLGRHAAYGEEEAAAHRGWRWEEPPPTPRHALYLDLWRRLIERSPDEQRRTLGDLRTWADAYGTPPARLLTRAEAARLGAYAPIALGGHTVHHSALPALDAADQIREIEGGKRHLEEVAGQPIEHFAYPYGRYDPGVAARVRAAGFACAVTTDPGQVRPGADRFALPRVQVPDLDGAAFARWLDTL